ncbi:MAG: hypothetical protein ABMA25_03035 [Ilumatobacteraceae bacterium]
MNDLDIFRRARPDIAPLDDTTAEEIRRAVFGAGTSTRTAARRMTARRALTAALAVASTAALAVSVTRGDGTQSVAPATPTNSVSTATTIAVASTIASTPSGPSPVVDWHLDPDSRFRESEEWFALSEAAREAFVGRCMSAAGFDYHGSPYETDTELANAAAGIQPGTYEAAYFGAGGEGGGCLDDAVGTIFGTMSAQVRAEEVRSWASVEWRRTALSDPEVQSALEVLAACAREHGVEVRDVASLPSKALDDVAKGMSLQTIGDRRLAEVQATTPDNRYVHSMEEMQAVARDVQNEWCPTFTAFGDLLDDRTDAAGVAWIEANPSTMADLEGEFAEDIVRFQYIIEHDGELPPS